MLADLDCLPQAVVASDEEVRTFLDKHALFGLGIGYIDAHLLASVRLTPDARLWTRDKRLHEVAERLSVDFAESRQTDAIDGRDRLGAPEFMAVPVLPIPFCESETILKTSFRRNLFHLTLQITLIALVFVGLGGGSLPAQTPGRTLIRAGRLLDVKTGDEATGKTIIVTGDRITAIAETSATPAAASDAVIDLTKYTVMPGLIDVHTHLTGANNFDPLWELTMTPAKEGIIGAENAKVTVEAGFTTVRNVGAGSFSDVALRDEINSGRLEGPHMQVSGPPLGITGGHMDENLLPFEYHITADGVADGIPAVQQKVRQNIKYGADLIKIGASGGVLSKGDDPQASQYTQEEMVAIVAEAHRLGRKVAAHAHGAQAILWATNAGVDSIEHGSYLDDAGIAAMKAHGTYLVPTAYLIDWMQANGKLPVFYQQKMKDVSAVEKQNAIKAIKAGVKIALGTDAAVYPHGLNAHEIDVYVNQFGMTPLQGIQTGTINAADLMGWSDKVGTLSAGKWADVIAVEGDPLQDVRILQHVRFVMKGGVVYKEPGAKQ